MKAVKSRGNSTTELRFAKILRKWKISGWRRHLSLPGTPDFAFPHCKVAVMIHGCFWHGCKQHYRKPVQNSDYWSAKVARNMTRDRHVRTALRKLEWSVLTFWEHDLAREAYVIGRLKRAMERQSHRMKNALFREV
jgi:DNA mismatch endonuclease, patch repair protein